MPDYTSDSNSSFDSMLGAFFGNVSRGAFGRMGAGIETLENKFKQLGNVAQSRMGTLRAGAERFSDAVQSINRGLREQADRIRRMPRMPNPPPQTFPTGRGMPSQPKHHSYNQPRGEDGRYLPGQGRGGSGRGWGWGGGGGGPRFASRFSPGGGLGGISAFGGLGSIGVLFGGASAARGFGQFDANLATLQAEAGLNQEQRRDVTGQILDISGSTQFSSGETAELLISMVKDGIQLTDALNQVPNVLRLAVAESTDLESAWSAMRGFVQSTNSSWEDSVRLSDMMSNATSLSAAKLRDLQDVASRGLTAHSSLEAFSTEGFLAITGILKSLNISNEVIGTGMRQFGTTIARATEGGLTPNAMAALQARGIQFERGMTEVEALKEIQAGVKGMADTELKNFFHEVFGERAKKVFENIIPKVDELEEKMELIRKKGTVNEKFEIHAKSLTNQMKLLTSAGDSLVKKFVMILNEGESFGGGIGWVTGKITQFTAFMEANKDTIQAWWGNFREIMGGLFNLVATGIEKAAGFWSGLSEGEKTIGALAAVIGAFVLGPVTGLIAAGVLIIAKWGEIKDFFGKLWDGMDEPVTGFLTTVRDGTMGVINWIRRQWDEMSPYFEKIWDGISFVANNAWKVIRFAAEGAWEFIKIIWQPVSAFFKLLWQGVLLATEVAWFAVKNVVKRVVVAIEGMWNGLKAVFNWAPVQWVRGKFEALIGFFADLVGKLKAPFEDFIEFVTGVFDAIAKGIETVRGWFRRGEEGEHRLVLTVDAEQAQKEVQGVLPKVEKMAGETPKTPETLKSVDVPKTVDAQKTIEAEKKIEYYETRSVKTPAVSGQAKPKASYQDFLKERAEATRAEAQRLADAGLGKKRTLRTAPKREFTSEVNRRYTMRGAKETSAMREDNIRRFGMDRKSVARAAHAFGDRRADLSRQKLFDRLQREFPKLFEKFYAPDVEKSPVIPELVLSGDDNAFVGWTQKLLGRMERQAARLKEPTTRTALGGFDKGGITADKLMNKERDKQKALESLLKPQGTKMNVFEFPTLTAEQHGALTSVFNSGFLSLADINSAQLAVLQSIAALLGVEKIAGALEGGNVASASGTVIKQQHGTFHDDYLSHRHSQTQKQVFENLNNNVMPPAPAPSKVLQEPAVVGNETTLSSPNPPKVVQLTPAATVVEKVQSSPAVVNIASAPPNDALPSPVMNTQAQPSLVSREGNIAPVGLVDVALVSVIAGEVTLTPPPSIAANTESAAVTLAPQPSPASVVTPSTLKEATPSALPKPETDSAETVGVPKSPVIDASYQKPIERTLTPEVLVDMSPEVSVANPEISFEPLVSTELPIITAEIQGDVALHVPVISPKFEDVTAPRELQIRQEFDPRFDELAGSLKMQQPSESTSEGMTAAGETVVKTSESEKTINNTFNITIEAGERSAEELYEEIMTIAQEKMREKNF